MLVRKVQKRMQLKNLVLLKFRNKYACSADIDDEVNKFIQTKVDELFAKDQFDERDLVATDKEIHAMYDQTIKKLK